jgi:diphthamide biosynthesis protein 2
VLRLIHHPSSLVFVVCCLLCRESSIILQKRIEDSMSKTNNDIAAARPPPPKLIFDDGSRVVHGAAAIATAAAAPVVLTNPRGDVAIREYYEIDRLVGEIQSTVPERDSSSSDTTTGDWRYRVALQFPDELLVDAPAVSWEFESALLGGENDSSLIFILGDTTYAACCPDTVAAAHLQANVLIHYGHACLSATDSSCHVLYSFGKQTMCIQQCQEDVLEQVNHCGVRRLLLLYEVQYHHGIEDLQTALSEQGDVLVVAGQTPSTTISTSTASSQHGTQRPHSACCEKQEQQTVDCCNKTSESDACCRSQTPTDTHCSERGDNTTPDDTQAAMTHAVAHTQASDEESSAQLHQVMVGGLELPVQVMNGGWSGDKGTNYTVLFIGQDSSRQYLNIVLRFLSGTSRPDNLWTWSPDKRLCTDSLSPTFQRILNRRFYLIQKAKQCRVFGILVAHLTEHTRKLVASLRHVIQEHDEDLTSYTFVVGKINAAKLANFPEIDCFVLVACPEHSLLSNERESYPIPIITPGELLMGFGVTNWGSDAYSTHPSDYWRNVANMMMPSNELDNDDSDAPYFSLVTGKYESSSKHKNNDLNLEALPGKGALTTYSSAAADFLRQREYQGLVAATVDDTVQVAVPGQTGIASNYSDR